MKNHRPAQPSPRRRGRLTIEILFVLPILFLTTIAVFQFGIAILVEQSIVHAATVAAREAGKNADADELVFVVNAILANHGLSIGDRASLVLEDPESMTPVEMRGSLPCDSPADPTLANDEVRVTVCVSMNGPPYINPLRFYGANFEDRFCRASTVVRKEFPDEELD